MKPNLLRGSVGLWLAVAALAIFSTDTWAARTVETIEAKKGDIASGTIVVENVKELRLKTQPCDAKSNVVVFYPAFTKTKIGTVKCGTAVFDRYQLEKK